MPGRPRRGARRGRGGVRDQASSTRWRDGADICYVDYYRHHIRQLRAGIAGDSSIASGIMQIV